MSRASPMHQPLDQFLLQINFVKPSKHTPPPVTSKATFRLPFPNCTWVCSTEDQVLVSEFTAHRHDFVSAQTSYLVVARMLSETMIPFEYHKSKSLVSGIINSVHYFASFCPKIIIFIFELEDQPREWTGAAFAPRQEHMGVVERALFNIVGNQKYRAELSSPLSSTICGARMIAVKLTTVLTFPIGKRSSDASDKTDVGCSICLSKFSYGEEAAYLPCSHIYHSTCIRRWLMMGQTSCPLCRFEVCMEAVLFARNVIKSSTLTQRGLRSSKRKGRMRVATGKRLLPLITMNWWTIILVLILYIVINLMMPTTIVS